MNLPIKEKFKFGYLFSEKTFYSDHHFGVDFICPCGTAVYAPENGKAVYFDGKDAGMAIYLKNKATRVHRLIHMSSRLVYNGKEVTEGELLGNVGTTGLSTGCHLDWSIYNNKGLSIENFIDPLKELTNNNMPIQVPISKGELTNMAWFYFGDKLTTEDIDWWYNEMVEGRKTLGDIVTEWDRNETSQNWKNEIISLQEQEQSECNCEDLNYEINQLKEKNSLCDSKIEKIKQILS